MCVSHRSGARREFKLLWKKHHTVYHSTRARVRSSLHDTVTKAYCDVYCWYGLIQTPCAGRSRGTVQCNLYLHYMDGRALVFVSSYVARTWSGVRSASSFAMAAFLSANSSTLLKVEGSSSAACAHRLIAPSMALSPCLHVAMGSARRSIHSLGEEVVGDAMP